MTGLLVPVFIFSTGLTLIACVDRRAWRPTCSSTARSTSPSCSCRPWSASPATCCSPTLPGTSTASCRAFRAGRELFWIRPPAGRLPGAGRPVELLPADRLGPDPGHRRLVGDVAHAPPARCAQSGCAGRCRWSEIRSGFRPFRRSFGSGSRSTPGSLATGVSDQVGTWILGAFGSLAAVGAWNRAWALSQRFIELNYRSPRWCSRLWSSGTSGEDRLGFDRALVDSLRYVAGGDAASRRRRRGRRGRDHGPVRPRILARASTALAIVLLLPAIATMSTIQADALLAVGRPLATTWLAGARLAATVPLTMVLTLSMGVTGTALGVTIGFTLQLAVQFGVLRAHLSQPMLHLWPRRQLAGLVVAYAGGFGARPRARCGHPRGDRPAGEPGGGVPRLCRLPARGGGNASARSGSRVSDRTKGGPELEVGHPACAASPTVDLRKNERHAAPIQSARLAPVR